MKYPIALLLVLATSLPAVGAPTAADWSDGQGGKTTAQRALLKCEQRVNRKWRNILKGTRLSLSDARLSKEKNIQAKIPTIELAIGLGEKHRNIEISACQFSKK